MKGVAAHLKAKLSLQKAIQSLAVGTAVRVVDTLVRAHDVSAARSHSVLKRPSEVIRTSLQRQKRSGLYLP
jgi:hypothetical protein